MLLNNRLLRALGLTLAIYWIGWGVFGLALTLHEALFDIEASGQAGRTGPGDFLWSFVMLPGRWPLVMANDISNIGRGPVPWTNWLIYACIVATPILAFIGAWTSRRWLVLAACVPPLACAAIILFV